MTQSTDFIQIPEAARDKSLQEFTFSVRLAHVFDKAGYYTLGDLHGMRFEKFRLYKNCGKISLAELRAFLEKTFPPDSV